MWVILIVFVTTLIFYSIQRKHTYWRKNGIPGPEPTFLIGNFWKSFIGKRSFGQLISDFYKEYDDYPFVGTYRATSPLLIIRDPELLGHVMVKDFSHFANNDLEVPKEVDPIFGRNPFVMKGQDWKVKRSQLTPSFTSGKIKGMFEFFKNASGKLVEYLEEKNRGKIPLEVREICLLYTLENVAACAFGLDGNSFDEAHSDFRDLADEFISPDNLTSKIKLWLIFSFPFLNKYIKLKVTSKDMEERLSEAVKTTLTHRRANNIVKNDFMDDCAKLQKGNPMFTDIDVAAHAASFFLDGYETSSRIMSYMVYELAANPDIQEELRGEINESFENNGNEFTHESVHQMKYLNACFNETIRLYPIFHHLGKVCTKDYTYTSTNPNFKKLTVKLKAGDYVAIPLKALQSDPRYFEEPEKYMPRRFLLEENIPKFTYLPFGEGPRMCLGQRFAIAQIKTGISYLIKHFRLTLDSNMRTPLQFDPYFIFLHTVGGLWVNFEKIG